MDRLSVNGHWAGLGYSVRGLSISVILSGRSPIAGDHRGWAQIRDNFLAKLGPLSGGTFRAELLDVAVGDTYVVAVQRATASRGKRTLDITGCQLILVSNGAIQTIRGHYSDQTALDAFWVE